MSESEAEYESRKYLLYTYTLINRTMFYKILTQGIVYIS